MKHWTTRVLKMIGMQDQPLVVHKDSDMPLRKVNMEQWKAECGQLWLKENFPIPYAGFVTHLLTHSHEWNTEGRTSCGGWQEYYSYPINPRARAIQNLVQKSGRIMRGRVIHDETAIILPKEDLDEK